MHYLSKGEEQTQRIGAELASSLRPGSVVALRGDLGAGKTAFVRGMAGALHAKDRVTSPTFTIVNEYEADIPIFHFDMYRLSGADELFDIGWEDYLDRGGICCVEWSENVPEAFDENTVYVTVTKLSDTQRDIEIILPEVKA